jgi:hypothetical protein
MATPRKTVRIPLTFRSDFLDTIETNQPVIGLIRNLVAEMEADRGGAECLSHAQKSLIRRAAIVELMVSNTERLIVSGSRFDPDAYGQTVNVLMGLYRTLGLERKPLKTVTSLRDVMRKGAA